MTTAHSIQRAKERLGINPKTAEHVIRNACERGKRIVDFKPGKERDWLCQRCTDGYYAVVYNGYCFILNSQSTCITLYETPGWFGNKARYAGKERIRNIAKYTRYNVNSDEAA